MENNKNNFAAGAILLDESLQTFVDSHLNSLLAWDIILFLYHRGALTGHVSEVAEHLGRTHNEVQSVFSHFHSSGLVAGENTEPAGGFRVAATFAGEVEPFIDALDQRQLRLAILAEVLRREYAAS